MKPHGRTSGARLALFHISMMGAVRTFVYFIVLLVVLLLAKYVLSGRMRGTSAEVETDALQHAIQYLFARIETNNPDFEETVAGFFQLMINAQMIAAVVVALAVSRWDIIGFAAVVMTNALLTSLSDVPFLDAGGATKEYWLSVTAWDPNPYINTSIALFLLASRTIESAAPTASLTPVFVFSEVAYSVSLLGRGRVCTIGAINALIAFISARSLVSFCESAYRRALGPIMPDTSVGDLTQLN